VYVRINQAEWAKAEVTDVKHGQNPTKSKTLCIAILILLPMVRNCLRIHIQMFNLVAITRFSADKYTPILTIRSICWLSLTRTGVNDKIKKKQRLYKGIW
jgi:hypothetical protein